MEHHIFFDKMPITKLNTSTFDEALKNNEDKLVGIFFWGHSCPNCEVAKNILADEVEAVKELGFTWFHVNVYEDFDLSTRYGLHGIPTFLFFYKGKKLGKISPFPTFDAFMEALQKLRINNIGKNT